MNIHLIGIGGVGMAGLAVLLKNRGHVVSGCDAHLGPRTRWLEAQGIRVFEGHDPRHLTGVDQVIVTPAVHADNAELRAAMTTSVQQQETTTSVQQQGGAGHSDLVVVRLLSSAAPTPLQVRCRGEVLAEIVSAADDAIAVCGSHGKTTTATWIARLLIALGESVEWAIGGETGEFPVAGATCLASRASCGEDNKRTTTRRVLVVEADESDGTLAQYHAKTLVVTNCEYDHPDHFKTRADYAACYAAARRNARDVVEGEQLAPLDKLEGLARLAPHNRQNARVAIEVALRRGHALDAILAALPPIVATLPDRRFQIIWPLPVTQHSTLNTQHSPLITHHSSLNTQHSVTVVTDYAHHPTEMRCAIQMARALCGGKLFVLFQPHRYSRTKALLDDFPPAFEGADEVVLCPTYAAFERPIAGGGVEDLYRACRGYFNTEAKGHRVCRECFNTEAQRHGGTEVMLAESCVKAWERVRAQLAPDDLVLLLGAGDIINLVPIVQQDLGGATCR